MPEGWEGERGGKAEERKDKEALEEEEEYKVKKEGCGERRKKTKDELR